MISTRAFVRLAISVRALLVLAVPSFAADDSERLLTVDHYVNVKSTVPAIAGQAAEIYVREKVLAGPALRSTTLKDRVVVFVHGAGTPAEVAFDVPYQDYSWMAYLARAGYDVFSMDTTGYGRSTRPAPMNDPCNLANDRQVPFAPAPCAPSYRACADDHPIGLGRCRGRGGLCARAAACRQGQLGRLVARRPARGRLRRPASGQGLEAGAARAGLQPERSGCAAGANGIGGGVQHAVARRFQRELGSAGRLRRSVRAADQRFSVDRDARVRSGRRDLGRRACAARRRRRSGDGPPRWPARR